jgi:hypothetical protein
MLAWIINQRSVRSKNEGSIMMGIGKSENRFPEG